MELDNHHKISSANSIVWIDYVKCVCLCFVYLAHSSYYLGVNLNYYLKFFQTFYVDAFFILSGYLFFRKQMQPRRIILSNIIFRLVIPSVVFSFIIFFPKLFIRADDFSWVVLFKTTIGGRGFWFTSSLVVAQICLAMVLQICQRARYLYVIIAILILSFSQLVLPSKSYPWFIKSGLAAVILLVMGGIYRKYEEIIDGFFSRKRLMVLLPLLGLYIWFVYYYDNLHVLGGEGNFNVAGVYCVLFSSYALIRFCKIFKKENRVVRFVGRNSILFYFFSGAFPNVISVILLSLFNETDNNYWLLGVTIISSILIAYVASMIIARYFPFLINLKNLHLFSQN